MEFMVGTSQNQLKTSGGPVDVQLVMFLRKWKLALFLLDRMQEDKARRCKKPHIKVKIGLNGVEPHNNSIGFPLDIFHR